MASQMEISRVLVQHFDGASRETRLAVWALLLCGLHFATGWDERLLISGYLQLVPMLGDHGVVELSTCFGYMLH